MNKGEIVRGQEFAHERKKRSYRIARKKKIGDCKGAMVGATIGSDSGLVSKHGEDVRVKNLVEANAICSGTRGSVQRF